MRVEVVVNTVRTGREAERVYATALALVGRAARCPVCGSPRFRVIPGGFECRECGQARR